jgi:hypothetical protein
MDPVLLAENTNLSAAVAPQSLRGAALSETCGGRFMRHPRLLFDGISSWPNLDQLFAEKSQELISRQGVNDWALAGGVLRPNGCPSFSSPSVVAFQTLRAILEDNDGFTYSNDTGVQWAALIPKPPIGDREYWRGVAVGVDFPLEWLESWSRRKHMQASSARLQELIRPGKPISFADQQARASISVVHRRLQLLDVAIKAVFVLCLAVKASGRNKVCVDSRRLAAAVWGADTNWPNDWSNTIFEAIAMLGTFRLQPLILPKTGWDPQTQARQAALSKIKWRDSHLLSVQLAPKFIDFVMHWLG